MIASLEDAWRWYESVRTLTQTMQRLGLKHWDMLPWDGPLGQDERIRDLEADALLVQSDVVFRDLDDLCVLLLFSVFEAIVRARVLRDVQAEVPHVHHVALQYAVDELKDNIEHGSFFRVLEPYKAMDASLIEEVNQVRRYRNWVAHGRHGSPPDAVAPPKAFERLQRFLRRLDEPDSK
jgi:hypothetical protein